MRHTELALCLDLYTDNENLCILDLGCGEGRVAKAVESAGLSVSRMAGVDWDRDVIANLTSRGSFYNELHHHKTVLDYLQMSRDLGEAWDIIIVGDRCIEHVDHDDFHKFLNDIKHVGDLCVVVASDAITTPDDYAGFDVLSRSQAKGFFILGRMA